MASDCLFCRIIAGEVPATQLHADDLVVAIRDVSPRAPTHILLMSREHVESAADVDEAHASMLARLFVVAAQLARQEGLGERGYRLVTNIGQESGQSVRHLHVHLLGGRRMGWPPG